jgi:branched-chain amino acid aminotransferase
VNGHVETTYSHTTGKWTPPEFVTNPYLNIHAMAPGLNYGQQCYEGLKALRNPDDQSIHIFRPDQNAKRMQNSARFVAMPEIPEELFLQCTHLAVAKNAVFVPPNSSGASMYIRPLLFGSSAMLGLNPPDEYTFLVSSTGRNLQCGADPFG